VYAGSGIDMTASQVYVCGGLEISQSSGSLADMYGEWQP